MAQNPEFNALKPFIYHAKEIESVNPIFAFYLKTYAIEKATVLYKKYQAEGRGGEVILTFIIFLNTPKIRVIFKRWKF